MMKHKTLLITAGVALLALVLGILTGRHLLPAHTGDLPPAARESADVRWTCSMHPQIQQPEPGDCPICGMDLIPVTTGGQESGPRTLLMSESAKALAEVQTTRVERRFAEADIRLVGKLEYDETRVKSLTARFPARIDTLYVNYTGIRVEQGEHLAQIYSSELLTAQRELITAHENDPSGVIAASARRKLALWDLLPEQIDAIIDSRVSQAQFELKAPIGGIVAALNVREGDYIKTGESLFKIVDLGRLWLMLDAYESDLQWLRYGQGVQFTVEAYPGETFSGTISLIEPELNRVTRTVRVRVNVSNEDQRLKPGMFARGVVKSKLAQGGKVFASGLSGKWISPMHPEVVKDAPGQCDVCGMDLVPAEELGFVDTESADAPLVIPSSAVLRTGRRAVVYVHESSADGSAYTGREIVLGPRAGADYIVIEGLEEGEEVVTHGAFKIDSALQIQAKPSMMNPGGGGPAPGHSHHGREVMPMDEPSGVAGAAVSIPAGVAQQLAGPYLRLHAALANDDLDASREALESMLPLTGHAGPLPGLIHKMLEEDSLDGLRRPHFEALSNALIRAVRSDPRAFAEKLYLMHCPMVYDDRGADWLQGSEELLNPYFGAMMLRCGEVKAKLTQAPETHNHHEQ